MRALAAVAVLVMLGGCGSEKPAGVRLESRKADPRPQPGELWMLTAGKATWETWEAVLEYRELLGQPQEDGKLSPSMDYRITHATAIDSGSRIRIVDIMPTKDGEDLWKVVVETDTTDATIRRQSGKTVIGQAVWIDGPKAAPVR